MGDAKPYIGGVTIVQGPAGPKQEVKIEYPDTAEGRKARRKAALDRAFGMWRNRTDIPKDGLEYERMMRDEWR